MDVEIRRLVPGEEAAFVDVDAAAFGGRHTPERLSEEIAFVSEIRPWGALVAGRLAGIAELLDLRLTLPGGSRLPMTGITWVGVLPTHRRRGILRRLMGALLDDARERGDPLAGLTVSEGPIYGRFGFGPAERVASVEVDTDRAAFREPPADTGGVEIAEPAAALDELPALQERVCAGRNGMLTRAAARQRRRYQAADREIEGLEPMRFALHRDRTGGVDGFLSYRTKIAWEPVPIRGELRVEELWAVTTEAEMALWRFCLEHDLMTRVSAWWRAVDTVVPDLLADRRAWRQTLRDGMWLRPLDPAALLAARRYGREDGLVLEIHEPEGSTPRRYRLEGGLEGASCVPSTASPDLSMGAAALGSICLGDTPVERLHRAGQVEELTPGAAARATAMFAWSPLPWSGDIF
jgi:predicted acetyltransferase